MSGIVEFVVKEVGGKGLAAIEGESGPIGWAILATEGLYALADDHIESVRDKAREIIRCSHLEICQGWGPPTALTVEYAFKEKGCAFLYKGVPLWHFQPNLNVSKLSSSPLRFNKRTQKVGTYVMHLEPCRSCAMKW
jgi:hypothetical protein